MTTSRLTRGRGAAVSAALFALALAISAGNASAAVGKPGKVKTRSQVVSLAGEGAIQSATATCPRGTRAAGGGFATSEPVIQQVGSSASLVFESRRIKARKWRASALQIIGGPMTLTSYVYCQARLGRVRARSQPINLAGAASTIGAATARCPRGSRAISGGFGTSTPVAPVSGAVPFESIRQGRRAWRVSAILGDSIAATLTSYVYCSRRRGIGPVFPASDVAVGQGAVADVLAGPCPRRRPPIAGGFVTSTPSLIGQAEVMVVFESRRIKRHWRVRGFEGGEQSTSSDSLIGAAYC